MTQSEELQIVHGAIATAYQATERALRIARDHAPMGISPLIVEACDQLTEAGLLTARMLGDVAKMKEHNEARLLPPKIS